MSLPTPPGTSHRGKENRRLAFPEPGPSRVMWSENHKIHTVYEAIPSRILLPKSASQEPPSKSILKKTNYEDLPPLEPEREITPEPADPLTNLSYLTNPVARIVSPTSTLRDLIEAYSILAARLRACVTGNTDVDASWPLFQPLREHREQLVDSMVRDLGRALEDPKATVLAPEHDCENIPIDPELLSSGLPSPRQSPKPKKRGMSAQQVKYARDLCTVCHSVLKLLCAVFTFPAIYGVFTEDQLGFLLTHVLAIPLANEIPTPNARKTCALSIWLIQTQRLPLEVLKPACDRIAYALRRGIDGELGKEGKKGSASDGLKAIHDLSICYPAVFVPAFAHMLPSVLSNLLASTLMLRVQACHALGGFAAALASLPTSAVHTRVACITAQFLSKAPLGTPTKKPQSPTKDQLIIRTLRTTLGAEDPKHTAQGPVWGLSVLANFVVMLGPMVYLDKKVTNCVTPLFSLAMRHRKSTVRGLGCLVWRAMIWAYFRPRPVKLPETNDEDVDDEAEEPFVEWTREEEEEYKQHMHAAWEIVSTVVDLGAGVSTIAAALANTSEVFEDTEDVIRRVFNMLKVMGKKGGLTTSDALEILCRLVNRADDVEWELRKLLPSGLFSANPGLLTADFKQLGQAVRPVFDECTTVDDIRCLTRDELTYDWVFESALGLWKDALITLKLVWGSEFPPEMLATWAGLLKANVSACRDMCNAEGINLFAESAAETLCSILRAKKLDLALKVTDNTDVLAPTSPIKPDGETVSDNSANLPPNPRGLPPLPSYRWKPALKLLLVRELWQAVEGIFPSKSLITPARKMLELLNEKDEELVVETQVTDEVRGQWSLLCAEIAYHCDEDALQEFWAPTSGESPWTDSVRSFVWSHFTMKWREEKCGSWESAIVLLGVPFMDPNSWEMSNEDLDEWESFLRITVDRALDGGLDIATIIDRIAATIAANHSPSTLSSTRAADLLLSHLEMTEVRVLPSTLFELINDTLTSTYPPEPRNKMPSLWFLRTLARTIGACSADLGELMLDTIQSGLCHWISDSYCSLSPEEYGYDIVPMYETVAVCMMDFPHNAEILRKFTPILQSAFCGREDKPKGLQEAFTDFWNNACASIDEPSHGWSAEILTCLRTVGLYKETIPEDNEEQDDEEVEAQLVTLLPSDELTLSPEIPSPRSLELATSFWEPASPLSTPPRRLSALPFTDLLRTPTSVAHPTTPRRPQKSASPTRSIIPYLPSAYPITVSGHSPATPRRRTSGNHRAQTSPRKADKENESPLRAILPVTERIAIRPPSIPLTGTTSVLGKRSLDLYSDDDESREGKKRRTDAPIVSSKYFQSPPSSPEGRDRATLSGVSLDPRVSTSASSSTSFTLPPLPALLSSPKRSPVQPVFRTPVKHKKRNGVFLEAVEVPTWKAVQSRTSSTRKAASVKFHSPRPMRSLPLSFIQSTAREASPTRQLRKARSATHLSAEEPETSVLSKKRTVSLPMAGGSWPSSRKQGSDSENEVESEEDATPTRSSPLRRVRDMEPIGSDDSFTLATPSLGHCSSAFSCSFSDPPSSDDDPHRYVGLVTPHHVVSPVLHRAKAFELNMDPGSDDSNLSVTPVKEHVARMSAFKGKGVAEAFEATPLRLPLSAFGSANGR